MIKNLLQHKTKLLFLLLITITAIWVICDYQFIYDLEVYFCVAIIGLISVFIFVVGLIFKKLRFTVFYSLSLAVSIVIAVSLLIIQGEATYKEKHLLVKAIQQFKVERHRYPKTLLELVPKYINSVPVINFGFRYKPYKYTTDGRYFTIGVDVGNNQHSWWLESEKSWDTDVN